MFFSLSPRMLLFTLLALLQIEIANFLTLTDTLTLGVPTFNTSEV